MAVIVTVLYPKSSRFDMDYYLQSHIPMVQKKFAATGLQKWVITQLDGRNEYHVQAILHFTDEEAAKASFDDSDSIMADMPNFTDVKPLLVGGTVIGEQVV